MTRLSGIIIAMPCLQRWMPVCTQHTAEPERAPGSALQPGGSGACPGGGSMPSQRADRYGEHSAWNENTAASASGGACWELQAELESTRGDEEGASWAGPQPRVESWSWKGAEPTHRSVRDAGEAVLGRGGQLRRTGSRRKTVVTGGRCSQTRKACVGHGARSPHGLSLLPKGLHWRGWGPQPGASLVGALL